VRRGHCLPMFHVYIRPHLSNTIAKILIWQGLGNELFRSLRRDSVRPDQKGDSEDCDKGRKRQQGAAAEE